MFAQIIEIIMLLITDNKHYKYKIVFLIFF